LTARRDRLAELRAEAAEIFPALPNPDWYDHSSWPVMELVAPIPSTVCDPPAMALPPGVVCQDLFEPSELTDQYLGSVISPSENKAVAWHYANMNSGCLVYVPPHTEVELTVAVDRMRQSCATSFHHMLIIADVGARLKMLRKDESADLALAVDIMEVVVKDGAQVELSTWQDLNTNASCYTLRKGLLNRDASLDWIQASFGGAVSKEETFSLLEGEGSQSSCLGLFFGADQQRFDLSVDMLHTGEHTGSDILVRGVLAQQARTAYVGRATIDKAARYASAFQHQNTLLLSKQARVDTTPELLIDVEEVQAGHATTVGQIDRDQLFYLMSRGLSRETATRMVIHGFVEPIVQRIPIEDEQIRLMQLIDRKVAI
jgi:Fe-S cluster assembly protein SufD